MKLIGNLLCLIFGGLLSALAWAFTGLFWCITVLGIPFGRQHFKITKLALMPFGASIE